MAVAPQGTMARRQSIGGDMWIASLTRSHGKTQLQKLRHNHEDGRIGLWWGPIVDVKHGDIVEYFMSSNGIEVESVRSFSVGPLSTVLNQR